MSALVANDRWAHAPGYYAGRVGDWMQTASGKRYYPQDPKPGDIDIGDIAHALAHLCRFGGHCQRFYSVAEHSVHVSMVVPPEHALAALMHDATEAYVVDIPRPLKRALGAAYATAEAAAWSAICQHFGLVYDLPECVKQADNDVLLAERGAIMLPTGDLWAVPGTPADVRIECWTPVRAAARFLRRFYELTR